MIAGWVLHLAILSLLLAGAARAAEGALRLYRRPVRWGWLGALWLPLLLPPAGGLWTLLARSGAAAPAELPPPGGGILLPALEVWTPAASASPLLDPIVGGAWALLAVVSAGAVVAGHRRLHRRGRAWSARRVRDTEVWVSPDFGPAVIGFLRPRIVLPQWLLEVSTGALEATLLHEEEHRRAGDTRLLLAGLAAVVLAPWNPVAWWSFRRLREAVEIDCDRRVLRRGVPRSEYGAALLTVGRRGSDTHLAAAALTEPPSFLERRLHMITRPDPRRPLLRAVGLTAVAGLLVVVACETPVPTEPVAPPSAAEGEVAEAGVDGAIGQLTISEKSELGRLLESGAVEVRIDGVRVDASALEALSPEDILRIEVVRRADLPDVESDGIEAVISVTTHSGRAEAVGPAFTPHTASPEMSNPAEVMEALRTLYPPLLRDAGVGGRVVVWFRISEEGEVVDARVAEGSGHDALDEAALEVARRARFTPARNGGRQVAVWVQIPIIFTP